ncbi:hypothetical protein ACFL54_03930 [Planctomycetota bacterium]
MSMQSDPFEKKLRAFQGKAPDARLKETVRRAVFNGSALNHWRGLMVWLPVAAAAVALLAFSLWWYSWREKPATRQEDILVRPEMPEGIPPLRLRDITSFDSAKLAILQNMRTIESRSLREGDNFCGYNVSGIFSDYVTLQGPGGEEAQSGFENETKWQEYIAGLNRHYQARYGAGRLDAQDMEILQRLALDGDERAVKQLHIIAASSVSPEIAGMAKKSLEGAEGERKITQLLAWAEPGNKTRYRARALQALGHIQAPRVRRFLRSTLENDQDEMLAAVIMAVAEQGDVMCLSRLHKILAHEKHLSPAVAQAARAAVSKLTGEE